MRSAGIEDIVDRLLSLFAQEGPKGVATLGALFEAGDLTGVQRVAHSIKSSAGNIRATELAQLLQSLEVAAKDGDRAMAEALLPRVRSEFDRVMAVLAK